MHRAVSYCASRNLFVKLEKHNPLGSIKDRTAYFIIRDLIDTGRLYPGIKLVESSSGNLGLALDYFAKKIGVEFVCLIDPTLPIEKKHQLESHGVSLKIVDLGSSKTYRDARILMADMLDAQPEWIWTRQYDNPANVLSHYKTTGPEIWRQTNNKVDVVVCSVGTGGTICGIGSYLKEQYPDVKIIAVEPLGSTIFGGVPGCYLSVGSGMSTPSQLIKKYGSVIDCWTQVSDIDALFACQQFMNLEKISLGVTAGSALVVAKSIAQKHPDQIVVSVAPDGGENYSTIFQKAEVKYVKQPEVTLHSIRNVT